MCSYSYSDEDSLSQSGTQLSESSGSDREDNVRTKAEDRRSKALADAASEEIQKLSEVDSEEKRSTDEKIEKLVADAEQEMRDKLAEYEELLMSEKSSKIDQGTRLVKTASNRRVRAVAEEASAERKRREREAEDEFEEAMRKLKDGTDARKKDRTKKKMERELRDAMQKKEDDKTRVEERRQTRRGKDSVQQGSGTERRRGGGGRRRNASQDFERNGERGRRRRGRGGERAAGRGRARRRRCSERSRDRDDSKDSGSPRRNGRAAGGGGQRGRGRRGQRRRSGGHDRELDDFRRRYPMEDRAFDQLADADPEVQKQFLNQFKPRSEGDSDYSGLVVTFLRSLIARQGDTGGHRDRGARDRSRSRGRSRERSRDRSREPRGRRRDLSPLSAFRQRYPMENRGFKILASADEEVRETVMDDFKPRHEGESDYTGLVIAFVRAVEKRLKEDRPRDRSNDQERRRKDDQASASPSAGKDAQEP